MRKRIGTGVWIVLFVCVFWSLAALAEGTVQVYDKAGLLDNKDRRSIEQQVEQLQSVYDMNFVILSTNDAEGKSSRDYADDFYMDHGFYEDGKKGGVTLLIDLEHREVWVSVAGDMQYYLTDSRVESVIDAGYGQLKAGDYGACYRNMLERVQSWLEEGIPADQYMYDEETGEIVRYRSIQFYEALLAAAIALAAAGISVAGVAGKYRMKWGTYKYPYQEKSKLDIKKQEDRFMNQIVTTRKIPKNPPSSSGGNGGNRTSTHTSSGGGSFSGGGRKF